VAAQPRQRSALRPGDQRARVPRSAVRHGKIDRTGKDAGIAQFREVQRSYGRKTIDLMQIFSLTDVDTHWPSLRAWKDSGEARYIGVTVSEMRLHDALERFFTREKPTWCR
jgi:diketogulonate reductase-like aldo/keto reductase